jgi:hypothetical protein
MPALPSIPSTIARYCTLANLKGEIALPLPTQSANYPTHVPIARYHPCHATWPDSFPTIRWRGSGSNPDQK